MCRLFGFRSILESQVHSSLVSAENALMEQSNEHPDGWGVAYYISRSPHILRSVQTAVNDTLFQRVSGVVQSHTVLAHLRKATVGSLNILNTHPFQFGRWVFAHNGNIKNFENDRQRLLDLINEEYRKFILGTTDSEILFFLFLSFLGKPKEIHEAMDSDKIVDAVVQVVKAVENITGPCREDADGPNTETYLTFLISNGESMLGLQAGKPLYFSTHKKSCPDRGSCKFFGKYCESPHSDDPVNHLIFSSEPLQGENVWIPLQHKEIICIDRSMKIQKSRINY